MGRRLIVEPTQCLITDDISIKIEDLNRYEIVEVLAEMTDNFGDHWTSSVMVQANIFGDINLAKATPILGSYSKPDPMGLFWSMKRESGVGSKTPLQPLRTKIVLKRNGAEDEVVQVIRHLVHPPLVREELKDDGLVGVFYHHGDSRKRPTVLVLGGSEGGLREGQAALIAAQGYNALSLAYFGLPNLPHQLVNIPLEYLSRAIDWLTEKTSVDAERIAVVGTSKGGELALLFASYESRIRSVVAFVPSSVIHQGLGESIDGKAPSSWAIMDEPLPYAYNHLQAKNLSQSLIDQRNACQEISYREWYRVHAEAAAEDAVIPVEKINGPILIFSGANDQLWPSDIFGQQVKDRLRKHHFRYSYHHLSYPKAGHALGYPGMPTTESMHFGYGAFRLKAGGAPEDNYHAQADAWEKMILFLKQSL